MDAKCVAKLDRCVDMLERIAARATRRFAWTSADEAIVSAASAEARRTVLALSDAAKNGDWKYVKKAAEQLLDTIDRGQLGRS